MAWYVSEPDTADVLLGPYLTDEEAFDAAAAAEANGTDTEVYYLANDGDTEDELRRALAMAQGDDMNDHDTDHR
jgi:hypothetical protein